MIKQVRGSWITVAAGAIALLGLISCADVADEMETSARLSDPPQAEPPGRSTCSDLGLSGELLGLCRAYTAQQCHTVSADAAKTSCQVLERNFADKSGGVSIRDLLADDFVTRVIPAAGGTIELPGTASVTFPAGAFSTDTQVTIGSTSTPETAAAFDEFATMFRPANRLAYELTMRTGSLPPVSEFVQVSLVLPPDFVAAVPSGHQIELLARVLQDGGEESVDIFELFRATLDPATATLTAELPTGIFSNARDGSGEYIAVVTAAPTPGINRSTSTSSLRASSAALVAAAAAGQCQAASIACPVGGGCTVTSPYVAARKHPVTGETRPHYGTDYRAASGTDVLAAADGTVERSYTSTSFGETIIVRHDDGGATLYAHLQTRGVAERARVTKGSVIGASDNTGLSDGPHLHFEYVPNGQIIQSKNRIDPDACVDALASGSITVRDNGSLADDAFEVTLDGIRLGETTIGGANTLAVSNLIPGPHVLGITATIAPDNVGTYQVTLNDGLTFAGGGTSRSNVLPQGGSATFAIVVPAP